MDENSKDIDLPLLKDKELSLPLFWPHVTPLMKKNVSDQLETRWLGQGPKVDEFEKLFEKNILKSNSYAVAVNSGTSALHLAYLMALNEYWPGAKNKVDGNVVCPVFTCTATNMPLLYMGLKIRWADVSLNSMNVSIETIEAAIDHKTRAIVVVHYGGFPVDMTPITKLASKLGIPVIEDAAQALGGSIDGEAIGTISNYTAFSFQAIKHITTGDGGLLSLKNRDEVALAKRLRWFGIDRVGKQNGTWENDIRELGYKYQMTDIAASLGVAGLEDFDNVLNHRRELLYTYSKLLKENNRVQLLIPNEHEEKQMHHAAWLATLVIAQGRNELRSKLREQGIESNPVHFRNDGYTSFKNLAEGECPNMDIIDNKYLCIPLHTNMDISDVERVSHVINGKW
jgi:perosamine synthetase